MSTLNLFTISYYKVHRFREHIKNQGFIVVHTIFD